MNEQLKAKCVLLIKNRQEIRNKFSLENNLMSTVAGLLYTVADREADAEKLKVCRKILRKNTKLFSTYRATIELAILSKMEMSEDPEKFMEDVKNVYKKMLKQKLKDSVYNILGAVLICDEGKADSADEVIERYKEIMKLMNDAHPFLTSSEDYSYAMLLALSDRNVKLIINDIEECIDYLKKVKIDVGTNSLQGISEVFAMTEGDIKLRCERTAEIFKKFKEKKAEYGNDYEFPTLAALADIDADADTLVDEVLEVVNELKKYNGFGDNKDERTKTLMFATILVAENHGKESSAFNNSVITGTLEIIKAKQTAFIVSLIMNVAPLIIQDICKDSSKDSTGNDSEDETKENPEK